MTTLSPTGVKILSEISADGEVTGHPAAMQRLSSDKFVSRRKDGSWHVTPAGREAIAAHRAPAQNTKDGARE